MNYTDEYYQAKQVLMDSKNYHNTDVLLAKTYVRAYDEAINYTHSCKSDSELLFCGLEIDKLPNVKKYWINDGYLNIELKTGDWIRLNFNNIQALKEQLTLTDVSQQRELLIDFYSKQNGGMNDTNKHAVIREVDNYIESIN